MNVISHYGLMVARICVAMLGAFLLYLAFFLYEDEAGRYQNRLEQLWIQIDDASQTALARHTAFLKKTIGLLRFGFDSLFGTQLFSLRSVAVTLAYSVGSFFLLVAYRMVGLSVETLRSLFVFLVLLMLGTSLGFIRRTNPARIWSAAVILLTICIFLAGYPFVIEDSFSLHAIKDYFVDYTEGNWGQIIAVFSVGIACDVLFVALNRAILRFSEQVNSIGQIIFLLICNLLLAVGYLTPFVLINVSLVSHESEFQETIWAISATNAVTALLASGMVFLTLTAFLHRAFWPLLSRPVYSLAQNRVLRNSKFLVAAGLMCLHLGYPRMEAVSGRHREAVVRRRG
jgi:hypothetical protein